MNYFKWLRFSLRTLLLLSLLIGSGSLLYAHREPWVICSLWPQDYIQGDHRPFVKDKGRFIVTLNAEGGVRIIDVRKSKTLHFQAPPIGPFSKDTWSTVAHSSNGARNLITIACSYNDYYHALLWDDRTGQLLAEFKDPKQARGALGVESREDDDHPEFAEYDAAKMPWLLAAKVSGNGMDIAAGKKEAAAVYLSPDHATCAAILDTGIELWHPSNPDDRFKLWFLSRNEIMDITFLSNTELVAIGSTDKGVYGPVATAYWKRHYPVGRFGMLHLPELWFTAILALALLWSIRRDWRELRRSQSPTANSAADAIMPAQ